MTFQLEWISYLNIALGVIVLFAVIRNAHKGLLLGLIHLLRIVIALVSAMLLSGPLAQVFPLLNYRSGSVESSIANLLSIKGSQPIWFVIVFIAVVILTKLLEPLIKLFGEVPLIGLVNHLGGAALGLVIGFIKVVIVFWLFTTPLISNGQEVIDQSYLSYAKGVVTSFDSIELGARENLIVQKYASQQPLTEEEEAIVESWFSEKGIGHDQIVDFLESIKNE